MRKLSLQCIGYGPVGFRCGMLIQLLYSYI